MFGEVSRLRRAKRKSADFHIEIKYKKQSFFLAASKQLKQITITERGNGSQIISGSEFAAGIYLYGLLVDGNELDVKRMILTD